MRPTHNLCFEGPELDAVLVLPWGGGALYPLEPSFVFLFLMADTPDGSVRLMLLCLNDVAPFDLAN